VGAAQEPTGPPDVIDLDDGTDAAPEETPEEFLRRHASGQGAEGIKREATPKEEQPSEDWLRLRVVASRPGVSLYAGPPGSKLRRLCLAPCETLVEPGRYQFAARYGTGDAILDDTAFNLDKPATIEAIYDTRRGIRIGGWVLFGVGATGALGSAVGLAACGSGCKSAAPSILIPIAVIVAGLVMVAQHDRVSVHRSRAAPPPKDSGPSSREAQAAAAPAPALEADRIPASP
jgi:hypothetical protein